VRGLRGEEEKEGKYRRGGGGGGVEGGWARVELEVGSVPGEGRRGGLAGRGVSKKRRRGSRKGGDRRGGGRKKRRTGMSEGVGGGVDEGGMGAGMKGAALGHRPANASRTEGVGGRKTDLGGKEYRIKS